ncbi:MAG TPA: DUF362 domain-containing protein, partial [Gemmataceae bacterium]|nr:DUF362 domain-containing protein [Gemmataceae bacterium]
MSEIFSNLKTLAGQAHAEGGWGYFPGQPAHLEPTCLALLALSLEPDLYRQNIRDGQMALERYGASPDGAYRLHRGREEAVWPTAQVLFVQTALDYPNLEIQGTAACLLGLCGRVPDDPEAAELVDIDCSLRGWPWAQGNFSWAEPTAWACLALRHAGLGDHPRVQEGLRLLLDRAADEGGINYGNRRILGRMTEPLLEPTAYMLLALQDQPSHPRIAAAVRYVQRQALMGNDLEQLSWAKLTLEIYQDQENSAQLLPQLDDRIRAAYQARKKIPWAQPTIAREALTALALAAGTRNFFRLKDQKSEAIADGRGANELLPLAPRPSPLVPSFDRIRSRFRGWMIEGAGRLRPLAAQTMVHIARAESYEEDLVGILQKQFEAFRAKVPLTGKQVVLKPNLVEYHRHKVINTDPRMVSAVIELCKREGASEIIVAEGPGHCRNVEYLVSASGLGDVLQYHRVPFIDLNHDEPVKRLNLGRLTGLEHLFLAQTVATAEVLISLPKLKTHHWAGATLS